MIKNIGDNYRIYGLIIVKIAKKIISGLSNATFETPNHVLPNVKINPLPTS
jgi:hypothetical protein